MIIKAICAKCFNLKDICSHSMFPKDFFAGSDEWLMLMCIECCEEIDNIIAAGSDLDIGDYIDIHMSWLQGNGIIVR